MEIENVIGEVGADLNQQRRQQRREQDAFVDLVQAVQAGCPADEAERRQEEQ